MSNLLLEYGNRVPDGKLNLAWIEFPEAKPESNVLIANSVKALDSDTYGYETSILSDNYDSYTRQVVNASGAITGTTMETETSSVGFAYSPIRLVSPHVDKAGGWKLRVTDGITHVNFLYEGAAEKVYGETSVEVSETDPTWLADISFDVTGTASFSSSGVSPDVVYYLSVTSGDSGDIAVDDYIDCGDDGKWLVTGVVGTGASYSVVVVKPTATAWPTSSGITVTRGIHKGEILHGVYTLPESVINQSTSSVALSWQETPTPVDKWTVLLSHPRIVSIEEVTINGKDYTSSVRILGNDGMISLPIDVTPTAEILVTYYYRDPYFIYPGYYEMVNGQDVFHDLNLNPEFGHTYDRGRDTSELLGMCTTVFLIPSAVILNSDVTQGDINIYRAADYEEYNLLRWTSKPVDTVYAVDNYIPWNYPPGSEIVLTVTPTSGTLMQGSSKSFLASVTGVPGEPKIEWKKDVSDVRVVGDLTYGRTLPGANGSWTCGATLTALGNADDDYSIIAQLVHYPTIFVSVPITIREFDNDVLIAWTSLPDEIQIGTTVTISASVLVAGASGDVTYSITDGSVGSINATTGEYTASASLSGGTSVTFVATSTDHSTNYLESDPIEVISGIDSIKIDPSGAHLFLDDTQAFGMVVTIKDGYTVSDSTVLWALSSDDGSAGTLSSAGPATTTTYTAPSGVLLNNQVAQLTATSNVDPNKSDIVEIIIGNPVTSGPVRVGPDISAGIWGSATYDVHRFVDKTGVPRPNEV